MPTGRTPVPLRVFTLGQHRDDASSRSTGGESTAQVSIGRNYDSSETIPHETNVPLGERPEETEWASGAQPDSEPARRRLWLGLSCYLLHCELFHMGSRRCRSTIAMSYPRISPTNLTAVIWCLPILLSRREQISRIPPS